MISLSDMARRAGKLAADNSPAILTAIGVTGVITTAYLTGKATFRAAKIMEENDSEKYPLEPKEAVALTWKLYIPAVATAGATIAIIIFANRVGSRRAAALAAAYSLSERAFEEYKSKVLERLGPKKEQEIHDEIAKDRIAKDFESREVVMVGPGSVLCYDEFTGRYFLSDMETIRKAQNNINEQVINDSYASLSDFYEAISLPATSFSDEVGWNLDKLLDIKFSPVLTDTGKPCIAINFTVAPVRYYDRLS